MMLRKSLTNLFVLLSFLTFLFVELSSHWSQMTSINARIFWAIALPLSIYFTFDKSTWTYSKSKISTLNLNGFEKLSLIGLCSILLINFYLGIVAPPNNYDSHTYHLSRIIIWIENKNVNHFPTILFQQLNHNVLGEYLISQTFLLFKTDRIAFLIQFCAQISTIFSATLLAKNLNKDRSFQLTISLLIVGIPIGIYESTSTQIDYIAAFFVIFFINQIAEISIKNDNRFQSIIYASLALVLGAFTKYTALLYCFPFSIYFGLKLIKSGKIKTIGLLLLTGLALFFLIFSSFFMRNYEVFDSILGVSNTSQLATERIPNLYFSWKAGLVNFFKNLGLHAGIPFAQFNSFVDSIIHNMEQLIGFKPNDPSFQLDEYQTRFSLNEDTAPNTLHFYVGLILLIFGRLSTKFKEHKFLFTITFLAYLGIFLSSLIFKFQLWSSRTQIPFFILNSFIISQFISEVGKLYKYILVSIFILYGVVISVTNPSKPLINVKYLIKQKLAYVPKSLIPGRLSNKKIPPSLAPFYQAMSTENIMLKQGVKQDYSNRRIVFDKLEQAGYYDEEKLNLLAGIPIDKIYFTVYKPEERPIIKHLLTNIQNSENIGLAFNRQEGFYFYWAYLNLFKEIKCDMRYIGFLNPKFEEISKKQGLFRCKYILTDDINHFLKVFKNKNNIHSISIDKHFALIKLNQQEVNPYLFN